METPARTLDPRLRVGYLVASAVGVFFLRSPVAVAPLLALQVVLWLVVGLGPRRLVRQVVKLWAFVAFIVISYAVTSESPEVDRSRWGSPRRLPRRLPRRTPSRFPRYSGRRPSVVPHIPHPPLPLAVRSARSRPPPDG